MEASKACDLHGLRKGFVTQIADAEQAYTQSKLGGVHIFVSLPKEQWIESWANMHDPVCPSLALFFFSMTTLISTITLAAVSPLP